MYFTPLVYEMINIFQVTITKTRKKQKQNLIYFKLKFFLFDNLKSKSKIYKKNKHKSNIPLEIKKKKINYIAIINVKAQVL